MRAVIALPVLRAPDEQMPAMAVLGGIPMIAIAGVFL